MNGLRTRSALTLLITGLTTACFSGCSVTEPTMRIGLALYPPAGAEVETTQAYQLVRWTVGDQQLALSPRGGLDDMLDLWLSIENQGEEPVDFFPMLVQYAYCRPATAQAKHLAQQPHATTCTAFAPVPTQMQVAAHLAERERLRQEADSADEAAMAAALIVFVFAFVIVLAAASSSGSSKRGGGRSVGRSHGHDFLPLRHLGNMASNVNYAGSYREAPHAVSPEAFSGGNLKYAIGESVIAAGQRHAGHIFIPPDQNATLLRLQIGVGSNTTSVEFDYRPQKAPRAPAQGRRGA